MAARRPGPPRVRYRSTKRWTAEGVIAALQEWAREEGAPPRSIDWDPSTGKGQGLLPPGRTRWEREFPRWPSSKTVALRFGSFSEGLAAAGLPTSRRRPELPLAERIAAAKRLAAAGHSAQQIAEAIGVSRRTARDYLSAGTCPCCGGPKVLPDSATCRPCAAGHDKWPGWERDRLLEALRDWARETGRRPSTHAWQPTELGGDPRWEREYPRWPPRSVVEAEFGSFSDALLAARLGLNRHTWRDEEILELIRAFRRTHGRAPTLLDWQSTNGGTNPPGTLVTGRFGGFSAALEAAGLEPNRRDAWSREEIVAALRRFDRAHGRPPRMADLRGDALARGYPSASAALRAFGTFAAAIRAAGLEPGNPPPATREEVLAALRAFRRERGRYPTAALWRGERLRPGASSVIRRFGSWSAAIAAAELASRSLSA